MILDRAGTRIDGDQDTVLYVFGLAVRQALEEHGVDHTVADQCSHRWVVRVQQELRDLGMVVRQVHDQ